MVDQITNKELSLEEALGASLAAEKEIVGAVHVIDDEEKAALWKSSNILYPELQAAWLDYFIALDWHLSRLQAGWIPATPSLYWRMALPRFMFEDMQHVKELSARREEYAKSTKAGELAPEIAGFLGAIAEADSAASFYKNLFTQVKPAILEGYRAYVQKCDPIADAPTVYILERIITEKVRQIEMAGKFFDQDPLSPEDERESQLYTEHVKACLNALETVTPGYAKSAILPRNPVTKAAGPAPETELHDPRLRILERFPQNPEECPVIGSLREIVYHMATEWQVISSMCYAYYELGRMPMEFFIDFSRHIWDECRHAQIGHRRLKELEYSVDEFIWPAPSRRPDSVQDYIAMLTLVGEACSFKRKHGSIIPFLRSGDHRSALLPSIDCVDERTHVAYGARWVPEIFKRYKEDQRPLRDIANDTRAMALAERNILVDDEPLRRQVSSKLPLFCSAIEFSRLDFTKY